MKTMSIKFNETMIEDIKNIASVFNISYSDFIRNAVKKEIEDKKEDFMFKMNKVEYCSEEEEKEILEYLSNIENEDLEIAERKIIEL